jgi:hypothetical protein
MMLTTATRTTALGTRIGKIVGNGSNPQVAWIDAQRGIARMTHNQPIRHRLRICQFPRNAVCSSLTSGNEPYRPVPVSRLAASPQPAAIWAGRRIDLSPETLGERDVFERETNASTSTTRSGEAPVVLTPLARADSADFAHWGIVFGHSGLLYRSACRGVGRNPTPRILALGAV